MKTFYCVCFTRGNYLFCLKNISVLIQGYVIDRQTDNFTTPVFFSI